MINNCIIIPKFKPASADPLDEFVIVKLSMEGENNSTGFVDEKGNIVTSSGAWITTDKAAVGLSSARLTGQASSNISIARNPLFDLGSQDFCIEVYSLIDGIPDQAFCPLSLRSGSGNDGFLFYGGSSSFNFFVANSAILTCSYSWTYGQFYHIAVTRQGTTWTLWIDGIAVATTQSSAVINPNSVPLVLGKNTANDRNFHYGNLDAVRITRGHHRYSAQFDPHDYQL